jgi:hypothetical protein
MILVKVYVNANGVLKIEYPDGTIKSPRSGSLSITQQVNGINIEIDGIPVTGKALQIDEIGKANDDAYADFEELETAVKDFFCKAPALTGATVSTYAEMISVVSNYDLCVFTVTADEKNNSGNPSTYIKAGGLLMWVAAVEENL